MAEDPYPGDPMLITPMTQQALALADLNPYVTPDTTPPATVLEISNKVRVERAARGEHGGPAPVPPAPPLPVEPPAPPPMDVTSLTKEELTDEVRHALDVLTRDGIVEQVDEDSWRFK
jgi:hypothetical protein